MLLLPFRVNFFPKKESCPPHLPSCILPLLYERATVHQPQQPVHSLDPPRLPSCVPSLLHRVTRITSLRAASPQSPVPSYPPPGQQTINQNCNWSCPESFKSLLSACEAILCLPNFIPWLACAVCAYVGGRTNLVALKIHARLIAYHDDTVVKIYNSFFDGDAECHTGEEPPASVGEDISGKIVSSPESIEEKSQFKLPESRERLGDGIIERIYSFTAYCFFFLSSLFLTCAFTSFTYFAVIKDGSIYVCIIIFFIVSFVALIIRYFVLFNQTNSNYKPWIIKWLSQLKDFLLKKFR